MKLRMDTTGKGPSSSQFTRGTYHFILDSSAYFHESELCFFTLISFPNRNHNCEGRKKASSRWCKPLAKGAQWCCHKKATSSTGATTSSKSVETLSLKNTFSSFQCPPYLEFKPFPLPLPSPHFNVDCLSSQHFFVLLATLIRGEGGCSVNNNAPRR